MGDMKVHGIKISTCCMRVFAALYEKDLDFELVSVNYAAGEHKQEPYLSLNPFGKIPALEDGDLKLFESRAITQYIAHAYADKGSPLIIQDPKKMATLSVWMEVETHQFDAEGTGLALELALKPMFGKETNNAVAEEHKIKLAKVLDVYESRLTQSKYLGADCFTLAVLHHLPVIKYLMGTRASKLFKSRPHVSAWVADIQARPSWQKVLTMCE